MAGAIDSEPGAAELLSGARADAMKQMKQELPGFSPVSTGGGDAPAPAAQDNPNAAVTMPSPEAGGGPSIEAVDQSEQHDDKLGGFANAPAKAPTPTAVSTSEDNTDPWRWDTFKHFTRDVFKGTGEELANVLPRVGAKWGGWITTAGAGLASLVDMDINKVHKIFTGKDDEPSRIADSIFDFKKKYIDDAVQHWTPERAAQTGEAAGSSPFAQAVGGGAEVVPNMFMGPGGVVQLVSSAGTSSTMNEMDQGHSLGTSVGLGTIDALATYVQTKFGVVPSLPVMTRILASMGIGDVAHVASQVLKKQVLQQSGYQKDADAVHPTDGLAEATVSNAIFGAFGGHKKPAEAAKPAEVAPTAEAVKVNDQATPPPPGAPVVPPVAAGGKIPDVPTAEPMKDLRAQYKDLKDDATPRTGVFMSTDNLNNLASSKGVDALSIRSQMAKASKEGRAVNVDNGIIITKTKEIAAQTRTRFANGEDPQKVIGELTGAGSGKTPAQTAVVQGHTPEGAVAVEKGVTPAEVPAAVADVAAQGHEPVVTTPAEAVARRAAEISKEGETPVQNEVPATSEVTGERPSEESPPPAKSVPRMGMFKPESGTEVPVHVEDGAPEGQVRVRPLDKEGEPSERTIDVPAARVRVAEGEKTTAVVSNESKAPDGMVSKTPAATEQAGGGGKAPVAGPEIQSEPRVPAAESEQSKPVEAAPVEKPQPVKAKTIKTAFDSLPEALATHEAQEAPVEGRKNAAPLAERQDNASSFAHILKAAAKGMEGKADETVVKRAYDAAKAAENLALKSKEATDKGQGTGHTRITALVAEMHKAARSLMGEAKAGDEVVVPAKQAEMLAKAKKKAAAPVVEKTVVAKPKAEPKVEVEIGEKFRDQVKPKLQPHEIQRKALLLKTEYVNAEAKDAPAKRAAIESWMNEHLEGVSPDQITEAMDFLDSQRRENAPEGKRGLKMSDTIEEEETQFDTRELSNPERSMSKVYRPSLADSKDGEIRQASHEHRMKEEWKALGENMADEGFLHYLFKRQNSGDPIGSHFLMDRLIKHTDSPILRDLLGTIRQHLPDLPVYVRDGIVHPETGASLGKAAGLFHGGTHTIQLQVESVASPRKIAQTLVHEFVHAATVYELDTNPSGQLSRAFDAAHEILINRLKSQYGEDVIQSHVDYFNSAAKAGDSVVKPDSYMRELYGIANAHEMASEILVNPDFQRVVAESEAFASPSEKFVNTRETLLKRLFNAIGQFFGVKDPKLLSHIATLTQSIMEAQSSKFKTLMEGRNDQFHDRLTNEMKLRFGANPEEIARAEHGLASLREEPPRLRGVDEALASIADDEATHVARAFVHSSKNRVTEAVRSVVTELKTVGQLFRDHMRDFGGEHDPSNPLRQLQEADISKNVIMKKMSDISRPVAEKWLTLSEPENRVLGKLLIDTTMYKIDPRLEPGEQPLVSQASKGFVERHAEFQQRFNKLSPTAREVYGESVDASKKQMRMLRRAGVDTAIHTFEAQLSDAQKSLLYGAKTPEVYDSLIGPGKIIDIGEKNDALRSAVKDFAGMSEIEGPYAHLGRQGEYVVSAEPEGTREFDTQAQANAFAGHVNELSPGSRGTVAERGGKWAVDYKAQYVSMHETRDQAEADAKRMTDAGFNVGHVTQKTMSKESAPLSHGMQELVAEAERKINRTGKDEGTEALVASLRSAFLQMTAARSAYAGSRLARRNFAGVKPEDMRRNFAEHSVSTMWHAAQMRTVFERAAALAKLRGMARDSQDSNVTQQTMYRRGEVVKALNMHARDEVTNLGHRAPLNSMLAKLGFMSYLASPAHAFLWMTQNFTTGIPVGGAKWGYGKSAVAHTKAMKLVAGPAFHSFVRAVFRKGGNSSDINEAIMKAVRADKDLGRWAHGENSPMQQLIDRGVIAHGYSNELGAIARGDSARVARVFEWARLMPSMADSFNRVTSALAALEMTGGDIRKAADFVDEIHANYGQSNKPLLFKRVGRVPGMNSITMFKTYIQAMAHLVYGNIYDAVKGGEGVNRAQAIKTVAGTMLGTALFAGVYGAVALEPLKLALYAYHKIADDEGEVWDFRAAVHHFLVDHFGKKAGNLMANGPIPGALGFDLSSRMGLSDLFFHEPPDLLTTDKDIWSNFIMNEAGPMPQLLANNVAGFMTNWKRGQPFQAVSSIIPVKAYQDSVKAYQLATSGARTPMGGQMTKPSGLDAFYQAVGFKPADVALAQQRRSENIEKSVAMSDARKSIVKDWSQSVATGKGTGAAYARVQAFNRRFPQKLITSEDVKHQLLFGAKDVEAMRTAGY